jgi:hypothetical protein
LIRTAKQPVIGIIDHLFVSHVALVAVLVVSKLVIARPSIEKIGAVYADGGVPPAATLKVVIARTASNHIGTRPPVKRAAAEVHEVVPILRIVASSSSD